MITSFRRDYFFLSNFFEKDFEWRGMSWRSGEHAYQASKACDEDNASMLCVKMARSPGVAKKLGRLINVRTDWEEIKYDVMRSVVRAKFSDTELARKLIATGKEELVEGNYWGDKTWGCVLENGEWEGRNMLGNILMEVRDELRKSSEQNVCPSTSNNNTDYSTNNVGDSANNVG